MANTTVQERLADLQRREAQVRANANPRYRAIRRLCLAQIQREREQLQKAGA